MKKVKSTINVSGLKVEDILNMDIYGMNLADTRKLASRLVSASNKRFRYLDRDKTGEGRSSPMYKFVKERGLFSIKGKNLNQIRNEISQMRTFLKAKSSKVKTWKGIRKDAERRIQKQINERGDETTQVDLSGDAWNTLWDTYDAVPENILKTYIGNSPEVQAFAYYMTQAFPDMSAEDMRDRILDVIFRLPGSNRDWKDVIEEVRNEFEMGGESEFTEDDIPF